MKFVRKILVFEKGRIKIVFRFQYDYELALKTVELYTKQEGEGIAWPEKAEK